MNNQSTRKPINILGLLCAINFNAAIIFLLVISVISAFGSTLLFDDYDDLYGPLTGNLRLMLLYLAVTEITLYGYCRFSDNYQAILAMGVFLLVLILALKFYSVLNQVPVDDNYCWLFFYLGLSHLGYGRLSHQSKIDNL